MTAVPRQRKSIRISELARFLRSLMRKRRMISQMVRTDFRQQYLGSLLGTFWAFVQPLVFVAVLWFVFAMGFRQARSAEPVPFVIWLMSGMFFWFFISGSIQANVGVIVSNSYLVNRVRFQLNILPVVKILSQLLVFVIFVGLLVILLLFHGVYPTLYWLQTVYFLAAAIVLVLGISWAVSALNVLSRDIGHLVNIVIRLGFWFTPIFWKIEMLPETWRFWVQLNPFHYLLQGFRDSLVYGVWFWERPLLTLYFWMVTAVVFVAGALVFKRLRPHFADLV